MAWHLQVCCPVACELAVWVSTSVFKMAHLGHGFCWVIFCFLFCFFFLQLSTWILDPHKDTFVCRKLKMYCCYGRYEQGPPFQHIADIPSLNIFKLSFIIYGFLWIPDENILIYGLYTFIFIISSVF